MKGKLCLITGASQGIGKATALQLAKKGAALVLVARDQGRGEAVVREIKAQSGQNDVSLLHADLSSMESIRKLAGDFLQQHQRLDVLINNAGAIYVQRQVSADGLEMTFAVNHMAYFLLTHLLLDRLKENAPSRIVNVASDAHRRAHIDFDDLQGERKYNGWRAYGQSKLANILFTSELARRLQGTRVTANCLHPGVVATGWGHNNQGFWGLLFKLGAPFLMTPEKGAATTIYLASSPEVQEVSGRYFARCKEARPSSAARDDAAARRLWELSSKIAGLPG